MIFDLVVPVAGKGSRFKDHGVPKPLIPITNRSRSPGTTKTMIEWSLGCFPDYLIRSVTLVTSRENHDAIEEALGRITGCFAPDKPRVLVRDDSPQGQAGSAAVGLGTLDDDHPVILANCDQWFRPVGWLEFFRVAAGRTDVLIPVFAGSGSRWSYAMFDESGVIATVEKPASQPMWSWPIVGVFAYRTVALAKGGIETMQQDGLLVGGESYIAPSINYVIREGMLVKTIESKMLGIGTPEDVAVFEQATLPGDG